IMGFAKAIEHFSSLTNRGLNEDEFNRADPPFVSDNTDPARAVEVRIRHLYRVFHEALQRLLTFGLPLRPIRHMMIFSDSAFIIADGLDAPLESIAAELMRSCFIQGVPLRIGLARGDYISLPFSSTRYPHGIYVSEVPFLGSAVVRAYLAQSLGCPGF